jgi:hypothetical protein
MATDKRKLKARESHEPTSIMPLGYGDEHLELWVTAKLISQNFGRRFQIHADLLCCCASSLTRLDLCILMNFGCCFSQNLADYTNFHFSGCIASDGCVLSGISLNIPACFPHFQFCTRISVY